MAEKPEKHMVLTVFMLTAGYYVDSWRMEGSRSEELGYLDFVTELTQMCERAKIDSIFFGDLVTADPILRGAIKYSGHYEPISTLSALAGRTKDIGLIGTVSTSFSLPFVLARQMSGLDSLSGGRAGWNIVTSNDGHQNFGLDEIPLPADRYRRAGEYVDVVKGLWDSWSDDAVINDRESGWWADPNKIRAIDHEGEFFKVKGPLNMRRSPQGHPVMVQAGSSDGGMELGARIADAIYTAQPDYELAIKFYQEIQNKVASFGRDPNQTKILPGILPIIGDTMEEAEELAQTLADHINFDAGRDQLENQFKLDLSAFDLDDVIPAEVLVDNPKLGSRYKIYQRHAREDNYTLRDHIVESHRSGAHLWAVGTASSIADQMIKWFDNKAADGFSLNPPHMPGGLKAICEKLVPELQERGYFRTEYEGSTLRENLGLNRPGAWDTKA